MATDKRGTEGRTPGSVVMVACRATGGRLPERLEITRPGGASRLGFRRRRARLVRRCAPGHDITPFPSDSALGTSIWHVCADPWRVVCARVRSHECLGEVVVEVLHLEVDDAQQRCQQPCLGKEVFVDHC